jgi:hypothetical protein
MGFVAQESWDFNSATLMKAFLETAYMMRYIAPARQMAHLVPFLADYMGEDIKAVMKVIHITVPAYIKVSLNNPNNGRVFGEVMGD